MMAMKAPLVADLWQPDAYAFCAFSHSENAVCIQPTAFAACAACALSCRFVFANSQLVNSAAPQPEGTPASKLDSSLVIEKIIILGLAQDSSYTATAGKTSYPVRTGMGVDPRMSKGQAVVVRTVNLPLNADWSLKVAVSKGTAVE